MAASRHLGFGETGSRSSRSAVPENPTIRSNTKSIGQSVAEIWPFETLTLMTSLMTSQGPDQKSVKNYFPQVGDHRVKKSAQSDKKCRRGSILKNYGHTHPPTKPQNSSAHTNYWSCVVRTYKKDAFQQHAVPSKSILNDRGLSRNFIVF